TLGFEAAGGSDDIEFRQSTLVDPGVRAVWLGGTSDETEFRPPLVATGNYETANVRIFDNIITRARAGMTAVACSQCTKSSIVANLILGNYDYVVRLIDEHGPINGMTFVPSGAIHMANNAMEVTGDPFGFRVESGT